MREIKFRAWDGEYMLTGRDTSLTCVNFEGLVGYADGEGDFVEEKNLILMQYTGKKDKNGKEIYEGDLFYPSKRSDSPAEVYYDDRRCQFRGRVKGEMQFDKTYDLDMWADEVIGNIYENPELLDK